MNLELLKTIETQILESIGMLVLNDVEHARRHLSATRTGLRLIINACEKHPMTETELEQEFEIRKGRLHDEAFNARTSSGSTG